VLSYHSGLLSLVEIVGMEEKVLPIMVFVETPIR
jgi:hypothetical protein